MIPTVKEAPVSEAVTHGAYRVTTFSAPDIARGARPGQFVTIRPGDGSGYLRRPFSVYKTNPELGTVSVAFDAIGSGTQWISQRKTDDVLDVVGPLGHGFEIPEPTGADLVIGGGYGTAALVFLADQLFQRGRKVHAIVGARQADRLFTDPLLDEACESVTLMTDDGSAGSRGLVVDPIGEIVDKHEVTNIYACGPNPMLRAVGQTACELGVSSQLAVEEFMACGIGVCWTCVLPIETNAGLRNERACTEGPVFAGESIAWT